MSGEIALRVRDVSVCPVIVPLERPIRTASGTMGEAPLLLIDVHTDQGVTGHSYLFGYQTLTLPSLASLVQSVGDTIKGELLAPGELTQKIRRRFTLLGTRGLLGMAVSGVDMATWDACSITARLPLATLLGGSPKPIPAYLGNGIGVIPVSEVPSTAAELAAEGLRAVKIRLGRPSFADDLAAVRAARRSIPETTALMADFNQSLTVTEAIRRGRALDGEGLYWIEEPVRADDFEGSARVAEAVATPVQIGENFANPFEMHQALLHRASDFVMADAQQIGGVSGWLRAGALSETYGRELSSHLFQEISAHLLAVSPMASWLEYMNVADPILREPLRPINGTIVAPSRPGTGIEWDDAAIKKYRVA